MAYVLIQNAARCNHCNTIVVSSSRHDLNACACTDDETSIFVDGGLDYCRMGCGVAASYEELHLYADSPIEDLYDNYILPNPFVFRLLREASAEELAEALSSVQRSESPELIETFIQLQEIRLLEIDYEQK